MLTARGSIRRARIGPRRLAPGLGLLGLPIVAACASVPLAVPVKPPVIAWEEKLGWIMRLEDQRILRDPNPPAPVVLVPATAGQPAIVAPPPPSDLITLLGDEEGRTRRRAALAVGRVGLAEAVPALQPLLNDPEPEVRQMTAFALGLIGDPGARPALLASLADPDPMVQGRAAEAIGMIGDRSDAPAVAMMVRTRVQGGALAGVAPDDLAWPLTPSVEVTRLGIYALARLGSFEALASAVLDASGAPVSSWWPVAYALARGADPRAAPALLSLLPTPGRFTGAFAARGLGAVKAVNASAALRDIVSNRQREPAVVIQAVRALGAIRDPASAPVLAKIVTLRDVDPTLRMEAATALGALRSSEMSEFMIDLLSDPVPALRAAAIRALAALDPDVFLTMLSGLDPDGDWTVRDALAETLGTLPEGGGVARLLTMLADRDGKVVASTMRALVAAKAPGVDRILIDRVKPGDLASRLAAMGGLADIKATAAVPVLTDAYRTATGGDGASVRAAVLGALSSIDAASARPLLLEAIRDGDWALRVKAAAILGGQGAGDMSAQIRPALTRPIGEAEWQNLLAPPYSPHAFVETDRGTIEIELAILEAPRTVANFVDLARKGFFDGLAVHRVVTDFVVQGGDPRGDGEGGPGYTIRDELNEIPYARGTVGMALDGKDSGGSQFFITHSPQPHLDARYTAFGRVVSGIDVVDRIQPRDVIRHVRIWDGTTPP